MAAKTEATKVEQIEREWDALWKLLKRRPLVFVILLLGAIASVVFNILVIPHLQKEINGLEAEKHNLNTRLSQRNDEVQQLELELTPFRVYAIGKYGGDERKALAHLGQELKVLREQLIIEKKTVREIHVRASLKFRGNWKPGFHGEGTRDMGNAVRLNILSSSNTNAEPIMLSGEDFSTTPDTNGICRCDYDAMLPKGAFPSGRTLDALTGYDVVELTFPGISHDKVVAEPVIFVGAELYLFFNGKGVIRGAYTSNVKLDLGVAAPKPMRVVGPDIFTKVLAETIKGL